VLRDTLDPSTQSTSTPLAPGERISLSFFFFFFSFFLFFLSLTCDSFFCRDRYASGGEDGYVRLHHFDDDYFNFEVDY